MRRSWLNLPNLISSARFPLALLFVLESRLVARVAIVAAAAASDWLDGQLARRTAKVTRAGELIDPLADKVFMIAALTALTLEKAVPLWSLPLLLTRDIGVLIGGLLLFRARRHVRLKARRPGKIVTWVQFAAVGAILLWPWIAVWIAPAVAVLGVYALYDYYQATRHATAVAPGGNAV